MSDMFDPGSPAVEQIFQAMCTNAARVTGFIGATPFSGVSSIARALATRSVLAGFRTLLVDLSLNVVSTHKDAQPECNHRIDGDARGFDVLTISVTQEQAFKYRNLSTLRAMLRDEFALYQHILIDAAPACESGLEAIPGRVAALACDALFLVCLAGHVTRATLELANGSLDRAGATVTGIVLNRRDQPTLGAEIAREARRFHRFFPRLSKWIENRMLASKALDVHA
jgi:Mrp family chromosome partitioning ATPase